MNEFLESFSNREISIVIWSSVIILLFFFLQIKASLSLVKQVFSKKFVPFYIVFGTYFYFIIKVLNNKGIWEVSLYKDFIFWLLTTGIIMFFNVNELKKSTDFKNIILKLISVNIVIEFIVGFYNFSVLTELFLIPIVSIISLLFVFADVNKEKGENLMISKFLNLLLSTIGIGILIYSSYQFLLFYDDLFTIANLKSFLFAPLFTVLFLPLIFFTVIYSRYEDIFININRYKFLDKKRKRLIKYAIIRYGNINLNYLNNAKAITIWRKPELKNENKIQKYIKNTIKSEVNFKEIDS